MISFSEWMIHSHRFETIQSGMWLKIKELNISVLFNIGRLFLRFNNFMYFTVRKFYFLLVFIALATLVKEVTSFPSLLIWEERIVFAFINFIEQIIDFVGDRFHRPFPRSATVFSWYVNIRTHNINIINDTKL